MAYAESTNEEVESLLRDTRKLKFLRYSKAHDHKELEQALERLVTEVDSQRAKINVNSSW
jgi:hypothetical protein